MATKNQLPLTQLPVDGLNLQPPPHSMEAEQSILGGLLIDKTITDDVLSYIAAEDMYHERHEAILRCITDMYNNRTPIDMVTVSDELRKAGLLEKCGGIEYLANLAEAIPTTANIMFYCKIVKEKAAQRRLAYIANEIKKTSFEGSKEVAEIIEEAINEISQVQVQRKAENGFVPDILSDVMDDIEKNYNAGRIPGIDTGFKQLDEKVGGWQKARYFILGARPKMGKTSFVCQLADMASEEFPVVMFSLEMAKEEIVKLLMYQNARIDSMAEQTGRLTEDDWFCLFEATRILCGRNLYIDDKSRTLQQIKISLNRIQKFFEKNGKGKIGMVVVDYLQLLHGDERKNRNYQLEEISRGLNDIKKEYDCTVLLISQLSRKVEDRQDCRPLPSDLRDTGAGEQDCDGLFLMYRDAYYNGRNPQNTREYYFGGKSVIADVVDVNMYLNRYGPTGLMQFDMIMPYRLFMEHKPDPAEKEPAPTLQRGKRKKAQKPEEEEDLPVW